MELLLWPTAEPLTKHTETVVDRINCLAEPWGAVTLPEGLGGGYDPRTVLSGHHTEPLDMELRKTFILNLTKCARHDFHRESEIHFFFGYYAASCAVRSFHPFKDKAFEVYLVLANRLAMASDDGRIRQWLQFIEENHGDALQATATPKPDLACSGALNFKLTASAADELRHIAKYSAVSLNKFAALALSRTISNARRDLRRLGRDSFCAEIRRFYQDSHSWKQFTVRISKADHGHLLSLGRQLSLSSSAVSSFLIARFLKRWPDGQAGVANDA